MCSCRNNKTTNQSTIKNAKVLGSGKKQEEVYVSPSGKKFKPVSIKIK